MFRQKDPGDVIFNHLFGEGANIAQYSNSDSFSGAQNTCLMTKVLKSNYPSRAFLWIVGREATSHITFDRSFFAPHSLAFGSEVEMGTEKRSSPRTCSWADRYYGREHYLQISSTKYLTRTRICVLFAFPEDYG